MRRVFLWVSTILLLTALSSQAAPVIPAEPSVGTVVWKTNAGISYRYLLYLPKHYNDDDTKQWPVIMFMHGWGSSAMSDLMSKLNSDINFRTNFQFIVFAPQCGPYPEWWDDVKVMQVVDKVLDTYLVNRDRVYVTGVSMGGHGSWRMAYRFPDYFAATGPVCGFIDPAYFETACFYLRDMPVWAWHGDADGTVPPITVPPSGSIDILKVITNFQAENMLPNTNAKITVIPGGGHNNCGAYNDMSLFNWFMKFQKRRPGSIRISSVVGSPAIVSANAPTSVTFSCSISLTNGTDILSSVTIDLRGVGGSGSVPMNNLGGGNFSYTYSVPAGLDSGNSLVRITVINSKTNMASSDIWLKVRDTVSSYPMSVSAAYIAQGINQVTWNPEQGTDTCRIYASTSGPINAGNLGSAQLVASDVPMASGSYHHVITNSGAANWYYAVVGVRGAGVSSGWIAMTNDRIGQTWGEWMYIRFPNNGMNDVSAKTRLEFYVKAAVGNVDNMQFSIMTNWAIGATLNLKDYGKVTRDWSKISVPMAALQANPSRISGIVFKRGSLYDSSMGIDEISFVGGVTAPVLMWGHGNEHANISPTGGCTVEYKYFTSGGLGGPATGGSDSTVTSGVNATTAPVNNSGTSVPATPVVNAYRVLLNFSGGVTPAAAPWNHIGLTTNAGQTYTGLVDSSNRATALQVRKVVAPNGFNSAGMNTGANTGVVPDLVMLYSWYVDASTGQVRVSGLSNSWRYTFTFFGSRNATDNRTTTYEVNGNIVSLNAATNTRRTVSISNVVPVSNGLVYVKYAKGTGSSYGYLNAIIIDAMRPEASTNSPDTTPPTAVQLWKPIDEMVTNLSAPQLGWSKSTDAGSGLKEYSVQISSNGFSSVQRSAIVTSTNWTVTPSLGHGSWKWRVISRDNAGNASSSISTNDFHIDLLGPAQVGLTSPTDEQTNKLGSIPFSWSAVSDQGLSGVAGYQIDVDSILTNVPGLTVNRNLADGLHVWRVRGIDNEGNLGVWSTSRSLVIDSTAPSSVVLLAPSDTSTLTSTSVQLVWNQAMDAVTGVKSYLLETSDNAGFTGSSRRILSSTNFNTNVADGTTVYWRVRATDKAGNTNSASVARTFSIDTTMIIPALVAPLSGSLLTVGNPTFTWTSFPNASKYQIEVRSNIVSGVVVKNQTNMGSASTNANLGVLNDGSYVFRVRAFKVGTTWQSWSGVYSFSVDANPPTAPTLTFPYDNIITNDQTLQLSWAAVSDLNGVTYRVAVDGTTNVTASTTYTTASLAQGSHTWTVKAVDGVGNRSVPASMRTIVIDVQGPTAPALISPVNNSTNTNRTLSFNWNRATDNGSSGVKHYQFVVTGKLTNVTTQTSISISALQTGALVWSVRAVDNEGNFGASASWNLVIKSNAPVISPGPTNTSPVDPVTGEVGFSVNPNPLNFKAGQEEMRITFTLEEEGTVVFEIYSITGSLVRRLDVGVMANSVIWDGRNTQGVRVASGTYLLLMRVDSKIVKRPIKIGVIR